MKTLFAKIFGSKANRGSPRQNRKVNRQRTQLGVESLESRCLMAGIYLDPLSHIVSIQGSAANDRADISIVNNQVQVTLGHYQTIHPDINTSTTIFLIDQVAQYAQTSVAKLSFWGGNGNDQCYNSTSLPLTARGDLGNDVLSGGTGADQLFGDGDSDSLEGRGGDDALTGGTGNDTYVFSGLNLGSDTITEAANADVDTLDFTGFGPKFYDITAPPAGAAVDLSRTTQQSVQSWLGTTNLKLTLSTNTGIEQAFGSFYADKFQGNARANLLSGSNGNDDLDGGAGDDTINGGYGNDNIRGGTGIDTLRGDAGTDTIVSIDGGSDSVTGGTSRDTFWLDQASLDTLIGVESNELGSHIHRVTAFSDLPQAVEGLIGDVVYKTVSYTAVPKTLNAPNLLDPRPCTGDTNTVNYKDHALFAAAGPSAEDVDQNRIPDCWMLSTLAAVADRNSDAIRQNVTELGDGTYAVRFVRNGQDVYYRVDADFMTPTPGTSNYTNRALAYAGVGQDGSIWVPIVQKAYAFFRHDDGTHSSSATGDRADVGWYSSLSYGKSMDAATAVGLSSVEHSQDEPALNTKAKYASCLVGAVEAGKAVTITGYGKAADWSATAMRNNGHAWTVMGVVYDSTGKATGLRLRNPYSNRGYMYEAADQIVTLDAAFASSNRFTVIDV